MEKNNDFEKVNDLTSIYELVSKYVKLDKVGKNYRGLCPFHSEKEPSFYVNPEINVAKCMGCGNGGKPVKFLSLIEKIPLSQALKKLADNIGYKLNLKNYENNNIRKDLVNIMEKSLSFYRQVLKRAKIGDVALEYLKKRGLTDDIIDHFNLGYSPNDGALLPKFLENDNINLNETEKVKIIKKGQNGYFDFLKGRIIFPIYNKFKDLIAFSGRSLKNDDNIKYLNIENSEIFEKGKTLFNINNLEIGKPIYIVEGFFDVISLYKAGINNAISQMGTSLSDYNCKSLKEYSKEIIMLYDGDNAGFNAILNNYEILLKNNFIVYVVLLNDLNNLDNKIDPDIFINKWGCEKFIKYIANNKKDIFSFIFTYYKNNYNLDDNNMLNIFLNKLRKAFSYANLEIVKKYENILNNELGFNVSLRNNYTKQRENDKINGKKKNHNNKALRKEEKNFMFHILHSELSYKAYEIYKNMNIAKYIKDERVDYIFGLICNNLDKIYPNKKYIIDYDALQSLICEENDLESSIMKLYTETRNNLATDMIYSIATINISQNANKFMQAYYVEKKKRLKDESKMLENNDERRKNNEIEIENITKIQQKLKDEEELLKLSKEQNV